MAKRAATTLPANTPYDRLRQAIIRGNISAGIRLVEQDVAERLGISRTPAREAIRRLHQDGFLQPVKAGPRTQYVVAPLTVEDMLDLYSIMAGLEGSAARNVGRLNPSDRRALVKTLRTANDAFVLAGKKHPHDFNQLFELHNPFHDQLVRTLGSPRLQDLVARVRPLVERYEYVYAPTVGPDYSDTFEEHAEILRAIRSGTPAAAEAAVKANWLNGGERLAAAMEHVGPRGDW